MMDQISRRVLEWLSFSAKVLLHIESYTIPQYGDAPNDQVSKWTPEECVRQMEKYTNRFGKNMRGEEDALRDLLKVAHFAGIVYSKLEDSKNPTREGDHDDSTAAAKPDQETKPDQV